MVRVELQFADIGKKLKYETHSPEMICEVSTKNMTVFIRFGINGACHIDIIAANGSSSSSSMRSSVSPSRTALKKSLTSLSRSSPMCSCAIVTAAYMQNMDCCLS